MPIPELKMVVQEELHKKIVDFINNNNVIIGTYEDMIEMILNMIRGGYCFNVDRERLRDAMEDITFICCPDDDMNRDRIVQGLEYEDEEDEEDEAESDTELVPSHNDDDDDDDDIEDIIRTDLEDVN